MRHSHHNTLVWVLCVVLSGTSSQQSGTYPPDGGSDIKDGDTFDFIVIGAGSAGSVVARRLSEVQQWKILVLEAGGDPLPKSSTPINHPQLLATPMNWGYYTEPQENGCLGMNNKQCFYHQGKCLGGTSALNVMLYVRGNAEDFDEWERMGNPGWGYKQVLEYFKKSENQADTQLPSKFHGFGGLQGVSPFPRDKRLDPLREAIFAATKELGYPQRDEINGAFQTGFAPGQGTVINGERRDTAKSFLGGGTISNLVVSKDSYVRKLILDKDKVIGVEYERNGEKKMVAASKEVVLSAGTLNSPQILMLSGIGPREHLQQVGVPVVQDIPGVGQNLQDHFLFAGNIYKLKPSLKCVVGAEAQQEYDDHRTGPFAGVGLAGEIFGFQDSVSNGDVPDIQIASNAGCINESQGVVTYLTNSNVRQDICDQYKAGLKDSDTLFMPPYYLKPDSRGTVMLRSKDPKDPPRVDPQILKEDSDAKTLVRGIRAIQKILQAGPFRPFDPQFMDIDVTECKEFQTDTDERYECVARLLTVSTYHYAGTCKMGPSSDPMAVVDPRLRVHGVKGLRVIDNSIMPKVTRGNTNAPAIMIGERGADFIKQDWKV